MKKALGILLIIILILVVGAYAFGSWYFADILINSPTQTLEDGAARAATVDMQGIQLPQPEAVSLPNGDVVLAGSFYDNPTDGQCAVLLLHGYTGTRYGTLQYAPLFWDRGCDMLAYDARAHGASTGDLHTFGYYEKLDAGAMVDWLAQRTQLPPSRIGLVGVSYGASTALQAAPLLPDAAFILADSAYQDLRTIAEYQAKEQYGIIIDIIAPGAYFFAQMRGDFDVDDVAPRELISEAQMPVLLIHSKQDAYTAAFHSENIFENANRDRTALFVTDWGAPHGASITTDYDAFKAIVDGFLQEFAPDFGLPNG